MMKQQLLILLLFSLLTLSLAAKKPKVDVEKTEEIDPKRIDLCAKLKCGHGKECNIDPATREAKCICVKECAVNKDPRRKVCSNFNTTWESDCHLHQHRCRCVAGLEAKCTESQKHMHIDYFGECKEIEPCTNETLADFPRRMREWLYNIMLKKYTNFEDNLDEQAHRWINAIIWKFCDLDTQPEDRHVSRHELFPLRAPLLSMESCISLFLDSCDPNDDHKITLNEWGKCLGADQDELEDKCSQFKELSSQAK